jgi:hypothetical protein
VAALSYSGCAVSSQTTAHKGASALLVRRNPRRWARTCNLSSHHREHVQRREVSQHKHRRLRDTVA